MNSTSPPRPHGVVAGRGINVRLAGQRDTTLERGRGGVEGPAGTANAVPLFTVVRIAVPLFKAGRTGAANVPPRMRDCSARAYSTYAWASTVKFILTKAIV